MPKVNVSSPAHATNIHNTLKEPVISHKHYSLALLLELLVCFSTLQRGHLFLGYKGKTPVCFVDIKGETHLDMIMVAPV